MELGLEFGGTGARLVDLGMVWWTIQMWGLRRLAALGLPGLRPGALDLNQVWLIWAKFGGSGLRLGGYGPGLVELGLEFGGSGRGLVDLGLEFGGVGPIFWWVWAKFGGYGLRVWWNWA